jgi:hypothetical protein
VPHDLPIVSGLQLAQPQEREAREPNVHWYEDSQYGSQAGVG